MSVTQTRNPNLPTNDFLEQTKMTPFVINNGYEWAFLTFRALLANETYHSEVINTKRKDVLTNSQKQFVRKYWGNILDYVNNNDYDYEADLFESWCKKEAKKLELPIFKNITVIPHSSTTKLACNTIYLSIESDKRIAEINEIYSERLQKALSDANQAISKNLLFSELPKRGNPLLIKKYERWLDAALIAATTGLGYGKKDDMLEIFFDLMVTDKDCWSGFKKAYAKKFEFHTKNLLRNAAPNKILGFEDYAKQKNIKSDLKGAFDRIRYCIKQGRGFIENAAEHKFAGARKRRK